MDAELRSAARRVAADPARALQARMRTGELSEEVVHLAALCRDEGAVQVLGVAPPETFGLLLNAFPDTPFGTEALTRGALEAWGHYYEDCAIVIRMECVLPTRILRGEEWAISPSQEKLLAWCRACPARGVLPAPECRDGKAWLSRDRMTRSLSSVVDMRLQNVYRPLNKLALMKAKEWELRGACAEEVRKQVEGRIVRWLLHGGHG